MNRLSRFLTAGGRTGFRVAGQYGRGALNTLQREKTINPRHRDLLKQHTQTSNYQDSMAQNAAASIVPGGDDVGYGFYMSEASRASMQVERIRGQSAGRDMFDQGIKNLQGYVAGSGNTPAEAGKRQELGPTPPPATAILAKASGTWPQNLGRLFRETPSPQDQETSKMMGAVQGMIERGGQGKVTGFSQGTASIRNAQSHDPGIDVPVDTHGQSAPVGGSGVDLRGRLDPVPTLAMGLLASITMPLNPGPQKNKQSERQAVSTGWHGHKGNTYMERSAQIKPPTREASTTIKSKD